MRTKMHSYRTYIGVLMVCVPWRRVTATSYTPKAIIACNYLHTSTYQNAKKGRHLQASKDLSKISQDHNDVKLWKNTDISGTVKPQFSTTL